MGKAASFCPRSHKSSSALLYRTPPFPACSEEQIKSYLEKTLGEAPRPTWGVGCNLLAACLPACNPLVICLQLAGHRQPDVVQNDHCFLHAFRKLRCWPHRTGQRWMCWLLHVPVHSPPLSLSLPTTPPPCPPPPSPRCQTAGSPILLSCSAGRWAVPWMRIRPRSAPSASRGAGEE